MEKKNENQNNLVSKKQKNIIAVIEKLLVEMHKDIQELIKFQDLEKNVDKIKEKSTRISKICVVLQNSLDLEKGGEVATNLNHLYQHIRFAVSRVIDDNDFTYLKSAELVTAEIADGWTKVSTAAA
tara:strand:+ start:184 stop:561 length:378 start_codon:yes stop_codon:yes gene_type:complete